MFRTIKAFFQAMLIFIAIAALVAAYARYVEPHRLTSAELAVENNKASAGFGGITVAVFADTHFGKHYTLKNFEKAVSLINSGNPDMILFCGDLIDDFSKYEGDVDEISKALSQLSAPMGKFAVCGNHDHGGGARHAYSDIMENGGFAVLRNEFVLFEDAGIRLFGLDDFLLGSGSTGIVREAADESCFNIVICHEPDIVDGLLDCSVDLMAAGHSHGGQVNLFGYRHTFQPRYGRNYFKGAYTSDNAPHTVLYVNPGLGTTKMPFRLMAPPEVTFIAIVTGKA
ncbi:MAG: metallophosphoesterase [Clostridiales bacterium]|nr:metallophosphoesterase [Clostridiales bacterium]